MLICHQSYGKWQKDVMVEEYRAPTPRRMEMRNSEGNRVSPRDAPVTHPFVAAPALLSLTAVPRTQTLVGCVSIGLGANRLLKEHLDLKVITQHYCHAFWPKTSWPYL